MSTLKNQRITPFLWFDNRAEEAMNFYVSIFPNSKITMMKKWPDKTPFPQESTKPGTVQTGAFILDGIQFYAFDAGPQFHFNEAISLFIGCKDQKEVDYYWEKLLADGGAESVCGWLKDRFGVSWQVVPEFLLERVADGEPERVENMMQAVFKMKKLDAAALEKAYNQPSYAM